MDTDAEPEIHENLEKPEIGELKSKPAFKVDLVRGNTTVSVLCSFVPASEQDDGYSKLAFNLKTKTTSLTFQMMVSVLMS